MLRLSRALPLAALIAAGCSSFKGALNTQYYPLVEQPELGVVRVMGADSMRFVDSVAYELYASSSDAARAALEPLDRVVRDWRRYFGSSPRLAVVVFDSASKLRAFDETSFRARGLPVVRVLRRVARPGRDGRGGDPNARTDAGRAGGPMMMPGDVSSIRGLEDRVARVLMTSYVERLRAASVTSRSSLPPWFREGAISLVASRMGFGPGGPVGVLSRNREASQPMPLHQLFAVTDSALGVPPDDTLAAVRGAPRPVDDSDRDRERGNRGGRGDLPRSPTIRVAAEGRSVLEFFVSREGPDFLTVVAESLARGQSVPEILAQAKRLPRDVGALDIQYRRWLAEEEAAFRR